jgi:hypothetical protein
VIAAREQAKIPEYALPFLRARHNSLQAGVPHRIGARERLSQR